MTVRLVGAVHSSCPLSLVLHNVRFGSKANIGGGSHHVRYPSNSGHRSCIVVIVAINGNLIGSVRHSMSHLSSNGLHSY